MGIVATIVLISMAAAQTPDWNRRSKGTSSGLLEDLEGEANGFGLGMYLGRPLGLSLSYAADSWLTQMHLGMWFPNTYRISVDQLYSVHQFSAGEYWYVPVNVGLGGFAYVNEYQAGDLIAGGETTYDHYGIRAPLSLSLKHRKLSFETFVDLVPAVQIRPRVEFDVYGGIGLRVYRFPPKSKSAAD